MISEPQLAAAGQMLLGILVTVAAFYDLRWRRIPNWLVAAGVVAGLAWSLSLAGLPGLGRSLAGLGLGFALYFPLYLLRARGAGDVKLLAAIGAITGAGNCFWIFFLTAILGGAIAASVLILRGRLAGALTNVSLIVSSLLRFRAPYIGAGELDVRSAKGMRLPHGALLFVGTLAFVMVVQFRFGI